jgi:hypothetical protein
MQRRAVLSVRSAWSVSRDLPVRTVSGVGLSRQRATVLVLARGIRLGQLLAVLCCMLPDVETYLVPAKRRQHTMHAPVSRRRGPRPRTRGRGDADE